MSNGALAHQRFVHKTEPPELVIFWNCGKIILGGWRFTYRIETDILMNGIQKNRMDRLIWTDGFYRWINICQTDI